MIHEIGSKEEYQKAFGDIPLGLAIRRIIKLDHQATMDAFAEFLNRHSLNGEQNKLMNTIINHIEQNGYIKPESLTKPPFDRPLPIYKAFDANELKELMICIRQLDANAIVPAA